MPVSWETVGRSVPARVRNSPPSGWPSPQACSSHHRSPTSRFSCPLGPVHGTLPLFLAHQPLSPTTMCSGRRPFVAVHPPGSVSRSSTRRYHKEQSWLVNLPPRLHTVVRISPLALR